MDRRAVLAALGAIGAGAAAHPLMGFMAPPKVLPRQPWAEFAKGPHFKPFVKAVKKLKADKDPESVNSLRFWANVHQHYCPHGKDYFLAWHRGYLFLFEAKLRELSGVDTLRLPYWDYFTSAAVPPEFLKGNDVSNPLYELRKGTGVTAALGYGAFEPSVKEFARANGPSAFEARIEGSPHNNVHNLVGGKMATMQSPLDLIFWLHHANIDRLWSAWLAAGQGRTMPPATAEYWKGAFDYAGGQSVDRNRTLTCEGLGYAYADLKLPVPAPPIVRSTAPGAGPKPPMVGAGPPPRIVSNEDGMGLSLDEGSVTVSAPIAAPPMIVRSVPPVPRVGAAPGGAKPDALPRVEAPVGEMIVILEDVTLTAIGAEGGYFYKIFVNRHGESLTTSDRYLGSIGPFQIAAALHHGGSAARIEIPATDIVRRLVSDTDQLKGALNLTFLRINADGAPAGKVIGIGRYTIGAAP